MPLEVTRAVIACGGTSATMMFPAGGTPLPEGNGPHRAVLGGLELGLLRVAKSLRDADGSGMPRMRLSVCSGPAWS